jgi:NitT/TauT family transport system substrate-binding protein
LAGAIVLSLAPGAIFPAAAQETVIKIGTARAISAAATLYSIEKGYFKEAGIKVELDFINSTADVMAMVAQNQYQIVEGGVSAGFFNAVSKGLPLKLVADRTSSPLYHNIMLRPELKDKITSPKDLKGKIIASNGPGSISTYEIGKVLATAGLSLSDVEIKVIPFTQMGLALKNGAVDAVLAIAPFTYQIRDQGFGVPFIDPDDYQKPQPVSLAGNIINTDWANKNQEAVRNFYVAYVKGVRAYCQAIHRGSTRQDMVDLIVKSNIEPRREVLDKDPWQSRDPNGQLNVASLMDIQDFYINGKFTSEKLPPEKFVDMSYIDNAVKKLGPFVLENKDSKVKGCR